MTTTGSYDNLLVALSVLIAVSASYAALDLAGRVTAASGSARAAWMTGGAAAMGIGIWSMHFTGMLAFSLPVPVAYHWPTVLTSLLVAILASAMALYVVSRQSMRLVHALTSSFAMGGGIAGLHYIAMAAMRMAAVSRYDALLVTVSVVLAIVFSLAALWLAFYFRHDPKGIGWRKIGSALVMGAAISAMHYTGMAAASFMPSAVPPDLCRSVSISSLGTGGIITVTLMILGFAILSSSVDRRRTSQLAFLSSRLLSLQDDERRRIARELHDSTAQDLTGLQMELAALGRAVEKVSPEIAGRISDCTERARHISDSLRTMSYLLHPPLLDELGLGSALRWYIEGFEKRSGIKARLEFGINEERLAPELETAVFRIVQESLTNIHRHSGSSTALVRLHHSEGRLVLEIQDEGKGMTQEQLSQINSGMASSVGFQAMRERTTQFGGNLEILSDNRGLRIKALIPLSTPI